MALPKFEGVEKNEPASRKREIQAPAEDFLTRIFEADISSHSAGLKMADAQLSEKGDLLMVRLDMKYTYDFLKGLNQLLNEWETEVSEQLITVLRARWFVVVAQGLEHLLQNSGDNKVYLVKNSRFDEQEGKSWTDIFVGVGQ